MKLEDPTLPYADIIPRRRRERAATDGQAYRLGSPGYDWRDAYPEPGRRAVIAASEHALTPTQVEDTVKIIGTVGGLLADLGFQVFPAKAMTLGDLQPSLLVWVGGEATATEERDRIHRIGAPGVSVGSVALGVEGWRHIDASELDDWRHFTKRFVAEIARLVDVPEAAFVSNNLSNEPRRTATDNAGRTPSAQRSDLHGHGHTRTAPDRSERQAGDS